jgi:transposase-like protein
MEFLVESLKKDKSASYADLRAKADEKKLKVFPIMYGRAKAILGLVKVSPRGQGKVAKAQAAMVRRGRRGPHANSKSARIRELLGSGMSVAEIAKKVGATTALVYVVKSSSGRGTKRGPGRPRKVASTGRGSVNGLDGLLEAVKNSERERTQMRAALEKIQTVIAEALG